MARRGLLGVLAGGAAALLSGCGLSGNFSYRFKMTVEIETPQGVRTGSSVYEVNVAKSSPFMTGNMRNKSVRGEAVAVDIAPGQSLFALLKTTNRWRDDMAEMSMAALDPEYNNDWLKSAARIASRDGIRSPADVAAGDYPLLVTFADIEDPTSVVQIDPVNLAASFGEDVLLKRIVVEVTNEAVTTGIGARLAWLRDYYSKRLDGQRFGDGLSFANSLSSGEFSTEASK
jgi:hypothetical protein